MSTTTAAIAGHIVWVHRDYLPNGGYFAYIPYHADSATVETRCAILNRIDNPPTCKRCEDDEYEPFSGLCEYHDPLNRMLKGLTVSGA